MKLETNVREKYLISEAENIFPTKRAKSFKEKNALLAISENSTFVKGLLYNNTHLSFVFEKSVDVDEHCEDEDDCRSNERQVLWKLVVRPKH